MIQARGVSRQLLFALLGLTSAAATAADTERDSASPLNLSSGGFVKLHLLHGGITEGRDRAGDNQLWIPHIPVDKPPPGFRSRGAVHARETRLWLRLTQAGEPTRAPRFDALVEYDLYERQDRYEPRLRHAYVSTNLSTSGLLIGQTSTTFTNTAALAEIDTGTAVANIVTRQPLVRWSQALHNGYVIHLALEESTQRLARENRSGFETSSGRQPDAVARLERVDARASISVAAMLREIRLNDHSASTAQRSRGGALSLAGRISVGNLDNLRFSLSYGNVLGRYSTLGTHADGLVDEHLNLSLLPTLSSHIAWQHFWTPRWRSTFALGSTHARLPGQADASLTKTAASAHANLAWAASGRLTFAAEYVHGWRERHDDRRGHLNRVQFTSRLNFSYRPGG